MLPNDATLGNHLMQKNQAVKRNLKESEQFSEPLKVSIFIAQQECGEVISVTFEPPLWLRSFALAKSVLGKCVDVMMMM